MNNILITGGAGFIGSSMALKLLNMGKNITVLDNLSPQIHGIDPFNSELFLRIKDKVNFIQGDVRNIEDWERALIGIDAIIHLAAETGTGQSMYEIKKYTDVNITGTSILLDYLTNESHSVKKVVVASSRAIYGEGKYSCLNHGEVYPTARIDEEMTSGDFAVKCPICNRNVELLATDENSKIHPTSIYGITKQVQEQMVLTSCKAIGIPAVAFRYQNVYGPGQSLKNPYTGILSIFSTSFLNNDAINIFEDGTESRDFVYIDDVVNATIKGLEKDNANYHSFNIGTGIATDVMAVADRLKQAYQSSSEIKVSGNYRIGDIRHNFADISKAKKLLCFVPNILFEEGIQKFVAWVKTQKVDNSSVSYTKSLDEMKKKGLYK